MDNKLALVVQFGAIDNLSGALRNIVGLGRSGSTAMRALQAEARGVKRELRDTASAIAKGSGNLTQLIDKERALEAQLARTNAAIDRQGRLLAIDAGVRSARARGEELSARGRDNLVGGAAMAAPFVLAVKGAADFESGMTDIALKANLSARETLALQRNIIAAAQAAHQLPVAMREGVDTLAGFGMTPAQAARMVEPIGKAATATKASVADLAATAYANASNLKVPIADTARALDAMTAAGNAGAFELRDMAQHFPTLTAQAQAFGQTGVGAVADLAAAAQIARKTTGDSASAANNLVNLFAKINTEETAKKFGKMGVDLEAAFKRATAAGQTPLEAIANITAAATKGDNSKLALLFGDMQAQAAVRALIQNMGEYRRIRAEAGQAIGTVESAFARRSRDSATQTQALMGNVQRLGIIAGATLLPALNQLATKAVAVGTAFAAWAERNPRLASGLIQGAAALVGMRLALGATQMVLGRFIGPIGSVIGMVRRFREMQGAAAVLSALRTGLLGAGRAALVAGRMMLTNPLIAAAALIGVAAYLIWANWDRIKAAFRQGAAAALAAWGRFRAMLGAGIAWLGSLPARTASFGRAIIQGLARGILAAPGAVLAALKSVIMSGVSGAKAMLGIRSPSRVFMGIGGHVTDGLALGIDRGRRGPVAAMRGVGGALAGALALPALAVAQPAGGGTARGGTTGGASAAAMMAGGPITIHVHAAPGQDPQAIADAVVRRIDQARARQRRGSYADRD